MKHVEESGMRFGDYPDEVFFGIENSKLHQAVGEGIKTVEFVLLHRHKQFLFVEAKTTCPNAANRDESADKKEKFEKYYQEISEKFYDSFQMFLTAVLKKTSMTDGIGSELTAKQDFSDREICFVLVIRNAEDLSWLAGPKAELEARLRKICQIWNAKVLVLNYELAREYGLAQ